jgi:hypothetical protein
MSYNVNGQNMLQWFYSYNENTSNKPNSATTTNFRINNVDISNNYVGFATNSKIPVSQLYTINYFSNGQSLGNLFELNLPVFSGTIDTDFKIWPPNGISGSQTNNGLLIQFYTSTTFAFNYKVTCTFVAVGGGGGGGSSNQSNAGGGGGGGQILRGSIVDYQPGSSFTITIGAGGSAGNFGGNTLISYGGSTVTAYGGGAGGNGKGSSLDANSSTGGSGSYSSTGTDVGNVTGVNPSNTGVFQNMTVYANKGSRGNDQNNDSGGGGGGGGAGGAGIDYGNGRAGDGGSGLTVTFISASGVSSGTSVDLAGGGGGGGRSQGDTTPGSGSIGGGASGGDINNFGVGGNGATNTGGGGGGAYNNFGTGGTGGSGVLFIYVTPDGVSL